MDAQKLKQALEAMERIDHARVVVDGKYDAVLGHAFTLWGADLKPMWDAIAAIREEQAAPPVAQPVDAGKWMPREPDADMEIAFRRRMGPADTFAQAYRAMYDAAPSPKEPTP